MIGKLIVNMVDNLAIHNNYSEDQVEQMIYTLKTLTYEFVKSVIIISVFFLLGFFKEAILILFIMIITKPFIGGYHEDSQIKCFVATVVIVYSIILMSENNSLNLVSCIILNLFSVFCIYNKAPVINKKMPLTRKELISRNRVIGIGNSIILASVSIIMFKVKWFSQITVWTMVIQVMLMFNKYEKKRVIE